MAKIRLSEMFWFFQRLQNGSRQISRTIIAFRSQTPAQQTDTNQQRLQEALKFFVRRNLALPSWPDAAKADTSEEFWHHWEQIPVMTKDTIRKAFSPHQLRASGIKGTSNSTGGSTGEPTHFIHDVGFMKQVAALTHLTRADMGFRPNMRTLVVWGSERDIGKANTLSSRFRNHLRDIVIIDGYRLSDKTTDQFLEAIHETSTDIAVYGFSTMLRFIAQNARDRGLVTPRDRIKLAWCGGEMLSPSTVELFKEVFGVTIQNMYGGREVGPIAYQASPTENFLQTVQPFLFCEVIDQQGKQIEEPGVPGRLVISAPDCRGTPFIRYDIGDLVTITERRDWRRGASRFSSIEGRQAGTIKLANGTLINNIFWNHLFKEFPEIHQFQVHVAKSGLLTICYTGHALSETHRHSIMTSLSNLVSTGTPFQLVHVPQISRTAQGKLQQVIFE